MKRFSFIFLVLAGMVALMFTSCDKPDETKACITVKYTTDTTKVVPFAHVRIEKYDVNVEGQCDEQGYFEHVFKMEAILDVSAWLDTSQTGTATEMYGETTIRLDPGKTVYKTVFIN
ncbi:hypothetical protein SDC9_120050 [bioreactor metagenome]|uniref:Uncharacterized protein n=1 Tax=bioreactor metagenome TaxID=1076179 RepID=A0A645C9M1_9ZZZZ